MAKHRQTVSRNPESGLCCVVFDDREFLVASKNTIRSISETYSDRYFVKEIYDDLENSQDDYIVVRYVDHGPKYYCVSDGELRKEIIAAAWPFCI